MKQIKKVISFSVLIFAAGFIGAFLGLEKTKLGQSLEKKLGIKPSENKTLQTAQGSDCIGQEKKDNSALFVGCNGFF